MKGQHIGYVRVSAADQHLDRQLADVTLDRVYSDKASGSSTDRPGLAALLDFIREGDVLHVHSIDRLARNLEDLLRLVRQLTDKGIAVVFHKEGLEFRPEGERNFAGRLMLQVMGAIAEFEREMIRERQREGIERARAQGRRCGRPQALSADMQQAVVEEWRMGKSHREIARMTGVSPSCIARTLRRRLGPGADRKQRTA